MKTLATVLQGLPKDALAALSAHDLEAPVTGVTSDSRQVKAGFVFVAVKGETDDGHDFLGVAEQAGAVLTIGEAGPGGSQKARQLAPHLRVPDSRIALARVAANFYGKPSHALTMVGVTGTSGKTTTTYLVESILKAAGHDVGVIGTVNFRHGAKVYPATHTTPEAPELQRLLAQMRDDGCTAVVMEVSSHALKLNRTAFVAFDAVVFTNLTPEHLDFHPDMEDYFAAKRRLFTDYVEYAIRSGKRPFGAVNVDDEHGRRLLDELRRNPKPEFFFAGYGLGPEADISGAALKTDLKGVHGEAGGVHVKSRLVGRFNASNVLAALAAGQGLDIDHEAISQGIEALTSVPGRLEAVENARGVHVLVDYAHKSDALEKVLHVLRDVKGQHQLITVFGCGGDRDRKKRPVMGRIAVELSDRVWITSDNPRTEEPMEIIDEIASGATGSKNYNIEPDRRKAIRAAIAAARSGDIVLIAGKGHEDYQILGTKKVHFDDREVAAEALTLS